MGLGGALQVAQNGDVQPVKLCTLTIWTSHHDIRSLPAALAVSLSPAALEVPGRWMQCSRLVWLSSTASASLGTLPKSDVVADVLATKKIRAMLGNQHYLLQNEGGSGGRLLLHLFA